MEAFKAALGQARAAASTGRDSLLRMQGISRDMNRAVRQTVEAIDGVTAEFGIGESYASRIVNVIDERLASTEPQGNESTDSVP